MVIQGMQCLLPIQRIRHESWSETGGRCGASAVEAGCTGKLRAYWPGTWPRAFSTSSISSGAKELENLAREPSAPCPVTPACTANPAPAHNDAEQAISASLACHSFPWQLYMGRDTLVNVSSANSMCCKTALQRRVRSWRRCKDVSAHLAEESRGHLISEEPKGMNTSKGDTAVGTEEMQAVWSMFQCHCSLCEGSGVQTVVATILQQPGSTYAASLPPK